MLSHNNPTHSKYAYYDPAYVPAAFGLVNGGSTCWFNSLIQFLIGIPAMNEFVITHAGEFHSANLFASAYIQFVSACCTLSAISRGESAPSTPSIRYLLDMFLARAKYKNPAFNMGVSQECTNEAFLHMVDALDHLGVERLFTVVYRSGIECPQCAHKHSFPPDKSIQVEISASTILRDTEMLNRYLKCHATIVDSFTCDACARTSSNVLKINYLVATREVIVVMFSKFYCKENILFPAQIRFPAVGGGDLVYQLVSQMEHSGTAVSGHHTARSLRGMPCTPWVLDDTFVEPRALGPSLNTFMIAYHIQRT